MMSLNIKNHVCMQLEADMYCNAFFILYTCMCIPSVSCVINNTESSECIPQVK